MSMPSKKFLTKLYIKEKKSVAEVAKASGFGQRKISYWLEKHGIPKRSISEAIYAKANPNGDPFKQFPVRGEGLAFLYGLGLGLYWGEGTKKNRFSVRLGNTDSKLIRAFLLFLEKVYGIKREKLRFELQIFSDVSPSVARKFWIQELKINPKQLYKARITPSLKKGTYREKNKFGVLTLNFGNKKLRNKICSLVDNLQSLNYDTGYSREITDLIKSHNSSLE
jgi:hypothetical protein